MRLASLLLVLSIQFNLLSQVEDYESFYIKNEDSLSSVMIHDFYINNYETNSIDSIMNGNAEVLRILSPKNYVIHELSKVLYLKNTSRLDSALLLISSIKKNPIVQNNSKIAASYETLYGILCYNIERPKEARFHYLNALNFYSQQQDSLGIKGNLINIGTTYFLESNYDSALFYFETAKALEDIGIQGFNLNLSNNLATVYQNTNRLDEAIVEYLKLIDENDQNNRTHTYNLGLVYYKKEEYKKSLEMFQIALIAEPNTSSLILSEVYRAMSKTYAMLKETDLAYEALYMSDSLKSVENLNQSSQLLDALHFQHNKELAIQERKLVEEKIQNKKRENSILLFSLTISLILLAVALVLYSIKIKKNKLLVKKTLDLSRSKPGIEMRDSEKSISSDLLIKIEQLLDDPKVIADPKLSIEKFSKLLQSNRTYVSECINLHFKTSFRSLVNKRRIKNACKMLANEKFKHYSIEGIALTVGYNSISSFNSIFKKETGITPSFFRKNLPLS